MLIIIISGALILGIFVVRTLGVASFDMGASKSEGKRLPM